MTLVQLRYFVALAEQRNFSRVGKQFFVTQAVVSYHIRALEENLGVKLFTRSTRSVRLTPAGHGFYLDVAPLLERLDSACQRVKTRSDKELFTFAYSRVCFGEKFNRIIDTLSQLHPNVEFVLERAEPEDDLLERLTSNRIDAALFFNPYPALPESLDCLTYGIYDQVVIVSERYRFAGRDRIPISEIEPNEVFAAEGMRRIEEIRTSFMNELGNHGIVLRDLDSVFAMVKANRGVACLPVIDDVNITGLCYIPLDDPAHKNTGPTLTLAWPRESVSPILRSAQSTVSAILRPEQEAARV